MRGDDLTSTRRRVVVKASPQGKSMGSRAKEAVLGMSVRVPAERLKQGARVVLEEEEQGKIATRDDTEVAKVGLSRLHLETCSL